MVFGALPVFAEPKPDIKNLRYGPITVEAKRIIDFDRARSGKKDFGSLIWRGGLVLTSPSQYFGGWSGLVLDRDGKRFMSVSDSGVYMTGELSYDGEAPSGLRKVELGPILDRKGMTLGRDRDRDAEAITLVSGTLTKGSLLISFEQNHRIGRYTIGKDGISAAQSYISAPRLGKSMRSNRGLEAMTVFKGGPYKGSVIAMAERLQDEKGNHTGWIWIKGEPKRFNMTDIGEYDVTDIASLSDGSVLVLERRFRWLEGVKSRVRRIDAKDLRPGVIVSGKVLLEANLSQEIDNLEAMAVHTGPGGETIVTLLSDNNFNTSLQRTVLLQFVLATDGDKRAEN